MLGDRCCRSCNGTSRIATLYGIELQDVDDWTLADLEPFFDKVQEALGYLQARNHYVRYIRGYMNGLIIAYTCNQKGDCHAHITQDLIEFER